ncbi:hypothetical protein ACOCJ7_07160 [Knoellia sp. CPCC 206453]|uniref:hypothetical protein n=1 Tax=Knoellia pratensis TaxID=3404796 RepID=UPI00360FA8AC
MRDALEELDVITTAHIAGYELGYAHGVAAHLADVQAAVTHQAAARVVAAVMDAPERDRAADKAAADKRAAWWAERRGETVHRLGATA